MMMGGLLGIWAINRWAVHKVITTKVDLLDLVSLHGTVLPAKGGLGQKKPFVFLKRAVTLKLSQRSALPHD